MLTLELVQSLRQQFPALARRQNDQPVVYLDGPAGTQVPRRVIDAIADYLSHRNANHGGLFATSRESDAMLDEAHRAFADLLGADDPDCVYFGPNMTTLTFALSRAIATTWRPGDEIIVTRLDHDANVTPWVLAARDADVKVRYAEIHREDCTLDVDHLRSLLNERTRLVAVGAASNSSGSINPIREIASWAHAVGAWMFVDAVHYAPHALIDVAEIGCDFLACSAYKFFGPHVGVMWGRRELLESLPAYKLRPAPNDLPGKWMTGTQSHETIAGAAEAVNYLADIGRLAGSEAVGRPSGLASPESLDRRAALRRAFAAIGQYEQQLFRELLAGLQAIDGVTIHGITDPDRLGERLPTVSITHSRLTSAELATWLADRGIFAWHGNYYALQLTEALDLEPQGMLRLGLVHYNTAAEVARTIEALAEV